jgi:hypothetical protein
MCCAEDLYEVNINDSLIKSPTTSEALSTLFQFECFAMHAECSWLHDLCAVCLFASKIIIWTWMHVNSAASVLQYEYEFIGMQRQQGQTYTFFYNDNNIH